MRHEKIKSVEHESQLYKRGVELSRKLHIPMPASRLTVKRIDSSQSVELLIDRYSRSFVRNMYNWVMYFCDMFTQNSVYGDGYVTNKAKNGVLRHTSGIIDTWKSYDSTYGYPAYGVFVGDGITAEDFDDYWLDSDIASGSGAGQLVYGAKTLAEGWNAGDRYFYRKYGRTFTNGSGGDVTVTECCIYGKGVTHFIPARDVVETPVVVADGESLEVTYEFRVYFP